MSPAHAYLDPGTVSIILQVILGGFAGLALAGRLDWNKLLAIRGLRRKSDEQHTIGGAAERDARRAK